MRERYDSITSPLYCRCLNQKIYFNARGFHHLIYDGSGKARNTNAVQSRLVLIPLIVPVLQNATDSTYEIRFTRKNRKKDSPSVKVEMWGLVAKVGKNNPTTVKVILRRENEGQFIFWSIMRVR